MYTGSVLMIFKQYTLNGKRRVSNGKRHVIQRKQTRENVCGLCLNANSCNYPGSMIGRGEDEESMSIEMIVRSIPKSMKKRAEALLAHLKEREDMITWDDMGQVLVDGVLIPRSNITDLVSDAMRPRKNFNPVGVHEFYKVLNKINIPKDIVRNEQRWSEGKTEEKKSKKKPWLTL